MTLSQLPKSTVMREYEIKIFRPDLGTVLTTVELQLSDSAAIRSAIKLAGGHSFEVWRGMNCIRAAEHFP